MSVTAAEIMSMLPQTGTPKLTASDIQTHIDKAKKTVESNGNTYTSDQLDILTRLWACYTVACALQGTNMTVDPYHYLDAYKQLIKTIGTGTVKKADLTGQSGLITVGKLDRIPDFRRKGH